MEQNELLAHYFFPHNSSIFVLKNLPEVVKGMLFSRYSRTQKDLKQLFIDEFLSNKDLWPQDSGVEEVTGLDAKKAEEFYERVLVGYGDDSVAELGGAHIAIEQISMLATKAIEEHRVGLSPLEKSTRYVYYDKKINGGYAYYKDSLLMSSRFADLYTQTCDDLFDTYSKIVRDAQPLLQKVIPGDENDKAYLGSIRAKACDIARSLLPLSAFTNMGVFGNGRAYEYLLTGMLGDNLTEVQAIGKQMHLALSNVIGPFLKRVVSERGEKYRQYLTETEAVYTALNSNYEMKDRIYDKPVVNLLSIDPNAKHEIVAAMLYQATELSYGAIQKEIQQLTESEIDLLIRQVAKSRVYRQHKPVRAFEEAYASFEIVADWGVYKDLMRHRVLTRYKKLFSSAYGYYVPPELEMLGMKELFIGAMDRAADAQQKIAEDFPGQSQYLVTHGSYTPFYLKLNMRALSHLTELRSSAQGHSSYRFIAQEMAKAVSEKYPIFGETIFKFVDYQNYDLERLEAFKKIEKKAKAKGVELFSESD